MDETTSLLAAAALATSFLSGLLGMGGGMILMGVLAWVLPPAQALALHGATQLVANGSRAALLRAEVRTRVLAPYLAGGALALLVLAGLRWVPTRPTLLVALGLLPWVVERLGPAWTLEEDRPGSAVACGLGVGLLHGTAGVSGSLLDLFFLRSTLGRRGVVATKAATQTLAHAGKLVYFGALGGVAALAPGRVAAMAAAAFLGTFLGRRALEHISERGFRRAGAALVKGAGLVYLARGLALALG